MRKIRNRLTSERSETSKLKWLQWNNLSISKINKTRCVIAQLLLKIIARLVVQIIILGISWANMISQIHFQQPWQTYVTHRKLHLYAMRPTFLYYLFRSWIIHQQILIPNILVMIIYALKMTLSETLIKIFLIKTICMRCMERAHQVDLINLCKQKNIVM